MKPDASLALSALAVFVSVVALVVSAVLAGKGIHLQKRLTEVEEGRDEAAARPKLVCQKMVQGKSCFIRVTNQGGGAASEVQVFPDREASGVGLELAGSKWNKLERSCLLSPGEWRDYRLWGDVAPGSANGSLVWTFRGELFHEPRDFT